MAASGTITQVSAGANTTAALATVVINGKDCGPFSFVSRIVIQAGLLPSYALCYVPLAALYDTAPSIAGVTTSPVYGIRQGDDAFVTAQLNPQFGVFDPGSLMIRGSVTGIDPDIGNDEALITIEDDRWLLDGTTIIGSWWVDQNGAPKYREGVKAHFNPSNHPNARWCNSAGIGVPLFTSDFYGIDDTLLTSAGAINIIPGESVASPDKSTYWTPRMKWQYFRFASSSLAAGLVNAASSLFGWYTDSCSIPDDIVWPEGLESAFDIANPGGATSQYDRKCVEKIYHCYNLLHAMHDICHEAGAFEVMMQPVAADGNTPSKSVISIIKSHYEGQDQTQTPSATSNQGIKLARTINGKASVNYKYGDITGGKLRESAKSYFSRVIVVGGHPFIETRLTSSITSATGGTLAWGWTASDANVTHAQQFLLTFMNGSGSPTFAEGLTAMFQNYQRLFTTYLMNPTTAFAAGTSQSAYPEAEVFRPPLPHLLTSYLPSGTGDFFAQVNSRRPIPVEYCTDDAGTTYAVLPQPDGLEIFADGTISFQNLRDSLLKNVSGTTSKTYLWDISLNGSAGTYTINKFQSMGLRITLAVPCDHRLTAVVGTASSLTATMPPSPGTADDGDRVKDSLIRTLAIDTGALHTIEERGGTLKSYPIPESLVQANDAAPPAAGDGTAASIALYGNAAVLRDDTNLAVNHALRGLNQVSRLDRGGTMESDDIDLMATPGQAVSALSNVGAEDFPVKAVIRAVEHDFEPPQRTVRHLY